MSSEQDPQKSLEMRVAAIEDKLAQATVTAEEMRAYQKVAALAAAATPSAYFCTNNCVIAIPISSPPPIKNPNPIARFAQQTASRPQGGEGFGGLGQ